jgi:hypothetical protein
LLSPPHKNLAQRDFKQAVAWVEALPAGPLREAGIDTAAKTRLNLAWDIALKEASPDGWVNPDVFQEVQNREYAPVIEWLASLPPPQDGMKLLPGSFSDLKILMIQATR